jgi:hypothetical protein
MGCRHGLICWYDNMGSLVVMTIYYDEVISCPFHCKYLDGLEQFAAYYEEAYSELVVIGELHSDMAKRQKSLTNLYDPSHPETKILVLYCKRNCKTFKDIINRLTDTHISEIHTTIPCIWLGRQSCHTRP